MHVLEINEIVKQDLKHVKRLKEDCDTTCIAKNLRTKFFLGKPFKTNTLKLSLHAVSANGYVHSFLNGSPR